MTFSPIKTDTVIPPQKWAFNEAVTACFDDMLSRSIPQYSVMRNACFEAASPFVQENTSILDLGCSRGEALSPFIQAFGLRNDYLGVEVSAPMREAFTARYADNPNVHLLDCDLRLEFPNVCPSVILSVLTLQFTPIEYRQRILSDIYASLRPGGAFILVEKVLGQGAKIDALMVETYLKMKAAHGYSQEQINLKRFALEGVLVPMTAKANEAMLHEAGFQSLDCFWRWFNFAGWIALKAES